MALRTLRGPAVAVAVNADTVHPAASLVKVPLAAAVYEVAVSGRLSLAQRVARRQLGPTAYPSILEIFEPDHLFTLAELCGLMLSTSDNPTSQHLLELVGMDAVNEQARRLGLGRGDTLIKVGFTDPELGQAGRANVTTAADMVAILAAVAAEPRYRPLIRGLRNSMRNVRLPLRLPDELHVAHKTGSLAGVVNDAGVVYGRDSDLAIAFLADHQADTALTSVAIGDCTARVWTALGEDVA
ncbi:MAG: serine hydrolase [Egibacteraceae bacterium]